MATLLDDKNIGKEFPLTEEWAYFATASNGILPERSRRYLERYFAESHYLELDRHYDMFDDLQAVRAKAAACFGGRAANYALQPNTTYGLAGAATAIPWRTGDNVVMADCEFPANVYPWKNLASRGVDIRWAKAPERKADAELLIRACDARTRAIAVAGVQFLNGYQPDLKQLAEFCHEREIWLCVDGIQGLGNRDWNLKDLGVDFMAAGGQKWLLSPRGSGLLYLSDRALDAMASGDLQQSILGWLNTERWQFSQLLDYDKPLSDDARRLEVGTYAFHDFICLGHSLDLIQELGIQRIAAHSDTLRDSLLLQLAEKNLLSPAGPYRSSSEDEAPERGSQIIALACPDAMALWKKLRAAKVAVNPREGGIRISFHYYNRESDLERLIDAL